jgi:hypothetical protein
LRPLCIAHSLLGCTSEGVAELLVKIEGNDGFGKVVEISSQNVGSIVYSVSIPDETLPVSIR